MFVRKIAYKVLGGVRYARSIGVNVRDDCRILTDRFGSEPWLVSIGNHVTISSEVTFVNHDGVGWLYNDEHGRRYRYAKIVIGDNVFVGVGTIILPGVSIGSRCVIGAGSVLTKSIPDDSVAAGNPARIIGTYEQLMEKVKTWKSEASISGKDYIERVNSIVDHEMKQLARPMPRPSRP